MRDYIKKEKEIRRKKLLDFFIAVSMSAPQLKRESNLSAYGAAILF